MKPGDQEVFTNLYLKFRNSHLIFMKPVHSFFSISTRKYLKQSYDIRNNNNNNNNILCALRYQTTLLIQS